MYSVLHIWSFMVYGFGKHFLEMYASSSDLCIIIGPTIFWGRVSEFHRIFCWAKTILNWEYTLWQPSHGLQRCECVRNPFWKECSSFLGVRCAIAILHTFWNKTDKKSYILSKLKARTSVTQKNVPSEVVYYYWAWYVFLCDRRYPALEPLFLFKNIFSCFRTSFPVLEHPILF